MKSKNCATKKTKKTSNEVGTRSANISKVASNNNVALQSDIQSKASRSIVKRPDGKRLAISKPEVDATAQYSNAQSTSRVTDLRKRRATNSSQRKPGKDATPSKKPKLVSLPKAKMNKSVQKRKAAGKKTNVRKLKLNVNNSGTDCNISQQTSSQQPVVAKKPPKFSFVVDGLLAGQGRPTQHGHIQFLCDRGFKYLVTLTLNKPRTILEYPGEGLTWVHIPIQDETPPSLDQIKEFVALVDRAKEENVSVAVHCAWGRGRTGTMLACYLAKVCRLTCEEALEEIRRLRPGSVDTDKQKAAMNGYIESLSSSLA